LGEVEPMSEQRCNHSMIVSSSRVHEPEKEDLKRLRTASARSIHPSEHRHSDRRTRSPA
jgi:hypothetical protein